MVSVHFRSLMHDQRKCFQHFGFVTLTFHPSPSLSPRSTASLTPSIVSLNHTLVQLLAGLYYLFAFSLIQTLERKLTLLEGEVQSNQKRLDVASVNRQRSRTSSTNRGSFDQFRHFCAMNFASFLAN